MPRSIGDPARRAKPSPVPFRPVPRPVSHLLSFALLAAAAVALAPWTAAGQTRQRWSLQGSVLFADLYGDGYSAVEGGVGGEAQVRYSPSAFSVGAGAQYTRHGDSGAKADGYPGHINLTGLFVEPRYVVYVGSQVAALYLSARVGFARLHLLNELPEGDLVWNSNGVTLNGGGGLLVRLGERVNMDLGATAGVTHYADADGTLNGSSFPVALGSGTNLVLRAGLAVGLGR